MILFRCSCGAAHALDDQYSGGTAQCEACGQNVPIPEQSDPSVVLVYKAGESEDGVPMLWEHVTQYVSSGQLAATDLVWHEDTWKPIGEVMSQAADSGEQPQGSKLRLRRRQEEPTDEELDDGIDDLSPVQHLNTGGEAPDGDEGKTSRGLLARVFSRKKATPDDSQKRKRGPVFYTAEAVLGLLAIYFGFVFGFGPLISHHRKLPTYVIVQNHEDVNYQAILGWRRLKQDLMRNSTCRFEVFVGMRERQRLSIVPTEEGEGQRYKLKVTLRPGKSVLVNLKQKGTYGIFDLADVEKRSVNGTLTLLAEQITGNTSPTRASAVTRETRTLAESTFKGTTNDLFFYCDDYQFSRIAMLGISSDRDEKDTKPERPKPVITCPPSQRVQFANGYALYNHDDKDLVDISVRLPTKVFNLNENRTIKVGSHQHLVMKGRSAKLSLSMRITNSEVKADDMSFRGNWDYQATGDPQSGWRWTWVFRGNAAHQGKNYAMRLDVDAKGEETVKVVEVIR